MPVDAICIPENIETSPTANAVDPFARARHARYFELGVVYHVVSRTRGNLFLLRPDRAGKLRGIVAGVFAEAKANWPNIANFATCVLSNHMHNLIAVTDGDPRDIADYMAFVKREICRRWKSHVSWHGSMWEGYQCTAVVTAEAQLRAFRYVLAQSVKEHLVDDPRDWPGFHCARSLMTGEPIRGIWFDGTAYGKALHAERAKKEENRRPIRRADYVRDRAFAFERLPALGHLSPPEYGCEVGRMVAEIIEQQRSERRRTNQGVLGAREICAQEPLTTRPVPKPTWFQQRRHLIVWDDGRRRDVAMYLQRYWDHQVHYRAASDAWCQGDTGSRAQFPELCFIPGRRACAIRPIEQNAA